MQLFQLEAAKYNVFPIDDRTGERFSAPIVGTHTVPPNAGTVTFAIVTERYIGDARGAVFGACYGRSIGSVRFVHEVREIGRSGATMTR